MLTYLSSADHQVIEHIHIQEFASVDDPALDERIFGSDGLLICVRLSGVSSVVTRTRLAGGS